MNPKHPIVIAECPKCGKMQAARSPYLETLKDEQGNPDPSAVLVMQIACPEHIEMPQVQLKLGDRDRPHSHGVLFGTIFRTL